MMRETPREIISAAVAHSHGAGSQRLHRIAIEALRRSGLGPGADPARIAVALGYRIRAVTRADYIARLDGGLISYLWEPDPRDRGLHVFVGNAIALAREHRLTPSRTDVFRLAGFLALPDRSVAAEAAEYLQPYAPLWFLEARRQSGSGTYLAIAT